MSATEPSVDILPCPFCGEYPDYDERWDEDLSTHNQVIWKSVRCGNDCASVSIPDGYDGGTAIERWNTRAPLTAATDPDFILAAIADVHDMDATLTDYAAAVSRAIRAAMKGPTP